MKVWSRSGSPTPASSDPVFNDMGLAPVLEELPEETHYVVLAIPAADGQLRLAKAEPSLFATEARTREIDQELSALKDGQIAQLLATVQGQVDSQAALLAQLQARKAIITLPDVTVPAASLITITAGVKTFTGLSLPGVRTTDTLFLQPKGTWPAGYGFRSATVTEADKVNVQIYCPVLAVGGSALVLSATVAR